VRRDNARFDGRPGRVKRVALGAGGTVSGAEGKGDNRGGIYVKRRGLIVLGLLAVALAVVAAGCGGGGGTSGGGGATAPAETGQAGETTPASTAASGGGGGAVTALPASSCEPIQYKGTGQPDVLIASDLVRQGADAPQNDQIIDGILYELDQAGWKAGDKNVAYQSCDDSTAQAGKWDSGKCSQNAQAYAGNKSLWGVIGTFNSGCAAIIIPVLNQAPGGGIGMVSAANTWLCLTVTAPTCDKQEPGSPAKWYPNGKRNYVRVVVDDSWQGAADALLTQKLGVKKVYILNDKEAYGQGVADNYQAAVKSLGIEVAGFEAWDPKQSNYEALMQKIGQSGAELIFFGGLLSENGAQILKDKVSVLGPNDGKVKVIVPDGFVLQNTIDQAGAASKGIYGSVAGLPFDQLNAEGKAFIQYETKKIGGGLPDPYSVKGAAAAQVLLNAIAHASDRANVIDQLLATNLETALGPVDLNKNGDPTPYPVSIYVAGDTFAEQEVIKPPLQLVQTARGL
jgi:branched-chain amino acid transport system substrate-binding protein